ncbi:hypothetical protein [Paracoccus sp. (in: a-proteobacteria)]|uniref:hypothetical protein n=1 Tax=Paracoccus sp. TaxID=267 RepID=UPI002AFFD2AC|nr:hypothetical protein [Paracoccus sp. (in: a-proteobacteria)]
MHRFKKTGLLATVVALMGGVASAETYSLATFFEPNHPITRFQHVEFADRVREASNGEIDFEVFSGGSLLPAAGTLEGVTSGVAQVSVFAPSYAPSALPALNAIADMNWLKPDPLLLAFAYADFSFNEEVSKEQWKRNGVLYGAGHATPIYRLMCRDASATLEDLRGKRVRMPGASYARFGDTIGLTAVNMPASEMYTAMERGAIDCACGDVTHLQSGGTIGELVDSINMVELPPYFSSAGLLYSRQFWQGLRDDQRRLLLDEGARSMVRLTMAYLAEEQQALDWAKEQDIVLNEPDAGLQKAVDDFVSSGVGDMAGIARKNFGIEDPEALFATFQGYIDKWDGLMAGVDRSSEEAVLALVRTEIFDKVDVSTYGMD